MPNPIEKQKEESNERKAGSWKQPELEETASDRPPDSMLENARGEDTAEEDSLQEEASEANRSEEDTPEEDTPEEDTPEEDTPEEDTPEEDTPEEDIPEEDTPEEDIPEEDTTKEHAGETIEVHADDEEYSHENDEGSVSAQVALMEEVSRLNEQISKQVKDITELKQHTAQLEEELEKSRARLRTMNQDFSRFRDRTKADGVKNRDEKLADILLKLLPIRDNLELASEHASQSEKTPKTDSESKEPASGEVAAVKQGIGMVSNHFERVLQGLGMAEVPSESAAFDPEVHEAMEVVIRPELADDTIVEVIQRGYTLKDRLLRPARVRVSRKKAPPQANEHSITFETLRKAGSPEQTEPTTPDTPLSEEVEVILEDDSDRGGEIESNAGTRKLAPRVFAIDLSEYEDELESLASEVTETDPSLDRESRQEHTTRDILPKEIEDTAEDREDEELGFEDEELGFDDEED